MQRYSHFARGSLIFLLLAGLLAGLLGPRVLEAGASPFLTQPSPCASNPTIAKWTFTGAAAPAIPPPSTGSGTLQVGTGVTNLSYPSGEIAAEDPAISFEGWDTGSLDNTAYLEFRIDTTGRNSIGLDFKHRRSGTGPLTLELRYSTDGTNFVPFGSPTALPNDTNWHMLGMDLSTITAINNQPNVIFRLYGYGASSSGGTWRLDNIDLHCVPTVTINQAATQADPASAVPVNFTAVFSQPINVGSFTTSDITQNGNATGVSWSIIDSGDHMNFTLSATALTAAGTIIPSIAANQVTDAAGYSNAASTSTDNSVTYNDTVGPTVTINQASGQADPANTLPINFSVAFSEAINATTFATSDIAQSGTATGITWSITDSGDHTRFTLSATAVTGSGTLVPSIAVDEVTDLVGNRNTASTSTDNTVTYTPTSSGPASALDVLINEVAWAGTSAARNGDEWIELYNTRTAAINLNGWTLTSYDGTTEVDLVAFDANDTIAAGGFFILARPLASPCDGTDDINIFTNVAEDKCFSAQLGNTTGPALRLYDSSHTLIDTANFDGGAWPAGSSSNYSSMERRGKILDSTSAWVTYGGTPFALNRDNVAVRGTPRQANWFTTITPTPSRTPAPPTKAPTARPPTPFGRPVINEFLPRPGFDWNHDGAIDVFDEFIEIQNIGPISINIGGWQLDDGELKDENRNDFSSRPFSLPSVTLQPGERILFYGLQTNILLGDGGDSVRLLNASGVVMDAYTYGIVKEVDVSWCRLPEGRDWYDDCVPTPGLLNSRQGQVPSMPPGNGLQPPICQLPDTLPSDFLFAECNGYGTNMWSSMFWDKEGWQGDRLIPDNESKWQSFVE